MGLPELIALEKGSSFTYSKHWKSLELLDNPRSMRNFSDLMDLPTKRVEEFLHQRIPLSKTLNCQVMTVSDKHLRLSFPKFANTVEGEAYSDVAATALCQLTGWTFLQVSLQRLDYKPLISQTKSSWQKRREIDSNSGTVYAECELPEDKPWQQFLRMLSRKARARVTIETTLKDELGETATLTLEYEARDLDPA